MLAKQCATTVSTDKVVSMKSHLICRNLFQQLLSQAWTQGMKVVLTKFKFGSLVMNRQFAKII